MKTILILLSFLIMALAYDDIKDKNYDTLVKDKTMQKEFFSCLVDVKPCNDFGNKVKVHVEEFMKDTCRECDAAQKHNGHILIQDLKRDFPDLYVLFEAKYDPSLKLLPALDDAIKAF